MNVEKYNNVAYRAYDEYCQLSADIYIPRVRTSLAETLPTDIITIIIDCFHISQAQHFIKVMRGSPCIFRFVSMFNKLALGTISEKDLTPRIFVEFEPLQPFTLEAFNESIHVMQEYVTRALNATFPSLPRHDKSFFKKRNVACIVTNFKQNAQRMLSTLQ